MVLFHFFSIHQMHLQSRYYFYHEKGKGRNEGALSEAGETWCVGWMCWGRGVPSTGPSQPPFLFGERANSEVFLDIPGHLIPPSMCRENSTHHENKSFKTRQK